MSEVKRGWYVLRAISGKEGKVKEYLAKLNEPSATDSSQPG